METVSVNRFRENLKAFVEEAVTTHTPLKVTRRAGEAFVVMSADDWEGARNALRPAELQPDAADRRFGRYPSEGRRLPSHGRGDG